MALRFRQFDSSSWEAWDDTTELRYEITDCTVANGPRDYIADAIRPSHNRTSIDDYDSDGSPVGWPTLEEAEQACERHLARVMEKRAAKVA